MLSYLKGKHFYSLEGIISTAGIIYGKDKIL